MSIKCLLNSRKPSERRSNDIRFYDLWLVVSRLNKSPTMIEGFESIMRRIASQQAQSNWREKVKCDVHLSKNDFQLTEFFIHLAFPRLFVRA